MSITTIWDNDEHTIIRHIYQGSWTMTEFDESLATSRTMIDTVDHKVHVIVDISESTFLPNGMIGRISRLRFNAHPRQDRTVVVGPSLFVQRLYDMFIKVYRSEFPKFSMTATLEEARTELAKTPETAPAAVR